MIESPSKDTKLRASWGSSVADAVNRHEAALSVKAARIANGRDAIGAPFPFQVIGGTAAGNAKLSIYVPQGSIVVADEEIDAGDIDGISAVDDAPGYYTVNDLTDIETSADGAQPLYLVVWRDETQTDPVTAATVTLDPDSISGTVVIQATIALVWASTTEITGDTYGAVAEQIIRSAVHVGRGSGGGGSPSGGPEFLFPYKLKVFGNRLGVYMPGRALCVGGAYVTVGVGDPINQEGWYYVSSTSQTRTIYLRVISGTNGFSATIGTSAVNGAAWNIVIGQMDCFGGAGGVSWQEITQYVVGAVFLPGAASSTGGQEPTTTLVDVVTDVSYSESSHKLTQVKSKLTVLGSTEADSYNDTVFEASPHANEHNSGN